MSETLELHILQSYPVSGLNRGQDGSPKSIVFGGVRRARISSQSQKRAERTSSAVAFPETPRASFTRRPQELLAAAISAEQQAGLDPAQVETALGAVVAALYGGMDEKGRLKAQVRLGADEVTRLAALVGPQLASLAAAPDKERLPRARALLADFSAGTTSADVALYGRFLAETDGWTTEAATSYAHAIGTHRLDAEVDYFSAVDDVTGEIGHIGETDLLAPTLYRVAVLDLGQLRLNLPDAPLAPLVQAWASRAVTSTPSGGQHGTFAHTLPEYVLLLARQGGHPVNLAGAFEDPVRRDQERSLALASAHRLEHHLSQLEGLYGPFGRVYAGVLTTLPVVGDAFQRPASLQGAVISALEALSQA